MFSVGASSLTPYCRPLVFSVGIRKPTQIKEKAVKNRFLSPQCKKFCVFQKPAKHENGWEGTIFYCAGCTMKAILLRGLALSLDALQPQLYNLCNLYLNERKTHFLSSWTIIKDASLTLVLGTSKARVQCSEGQSQGSEDAWDMKKCTVVEKHSSPWRQQPGARSKDLVRGLPDMKRRGRGGTCSDLAWRKTFIWSSCNNSKWRETESCHCHGVSGDPRIVVRGSPDFNGRHLNCLQQHEACWSLVLWL